MEQTEENTQKWSVNVPFLLATGFVSATAAFAWPFLMPALHRFAPYMAAVMNGVRNGMENPDIECCVCFLGTRVMQECGSCFAKAWCICGREEGC